MIKGKIVLTVALLGISIGSLGVTSTTARAKSKYVTTPTSVRGKWFQSYKGSKNTGQYLRITKYTFYVANYMNGHKESGSWSVSGKKHMKYIGMQLFVSKQSSKKGYWYIGGNGSDGIWHLKRTIHRGKKALKSWGYNIGDSKHPIFVDYYYAR